MTSNRDGKQTTIGIFYDGNYFLHVSNYYNYFHNRKTRISLSGLHDFIRYKVAQLESKDVSLCQIVDAHYFRGRQSAAEASQKPNQLYYERVFEDILMSVGVTTHYLPLRRFSGTRQEKGIDVWLALETLELNMYKHFNVIALVAADGDYVPLIRKLNSMGTRVMLLSWDFDFTDDDGGRMVTRTSQELLEVASYPLAMHELIENRLNKNDMLINNLFVQNENRKPAPRPVNPEIIAEPQLSTILSVKNGFGFIKYPPNNLFFHYSELIDVDFNDIREGDNVEFSIAVNDKGESIARSIKLMSSASVSNAEDGLS